jgi:hypothetical protein
MFPGVVVEFGVQLFFRVFVSVFLSSHGEGASRFGYQGAEFLLGGGVRAGWEG